MVVVLAPTHSVEIPNNNNNSAKLFTIPYISVPLSPFAIDNTIVINQNPKIKVVHEQYASQKTCSHNIACHDRHINHEQRFSKPYPSMGKGLKDFGHIHTIFNFIPGSFYCLYHSFLHCLAFAFYCHCHYYYKYGEVVIVYSGEVMNISWAFNEIRASDRRNLSSDRCYGCLLTYSKHQAG